MKQKATLTYIENNIEKKVNLNFFNQNKMLAKIFKIKEICKNYLYSYRPYHDIELIHIKNYTFKNILRIERNYHYVTNSKAPIIILENCIFEGDLLEIKYDSIIEIINPHFKKNSQIEIQNALIVNITLDEESKDIRLKMDYCKDVNINASHCLKHIEVWEGDKIHIKNLNSYLEHSAIFYPKELIIEDSNLEIRKIKADKITLKRSKVEESGLNDLYSVKEIKLENSIMSSKTDINIPKLTKLEFNDDKDLTPSSLQAINFIKIGENKFINQKQETSLIISEETLKNNTSIKRQQLLLILKELRRKINDEIELSLDEKSKTLNNEIKEYDTVRNLELQQEIQIRKSIIERELNYKKEEANTKLDKTKNYLLSRPISTYSNSFKVNTELEDKNKTRQLRKKEFIKELDRIDRRKRLTQNKNN